MKLVFSGVTASMLFAGCCTPLAPLPEVEEAKVRYMIPDDDSGLVLIPMDDFSNWVSVTGRLRVNDNICREGSK